MRRGAKRQMVREQIKVETGSHGHVEVQLSAKEVQSSGITAQMPSPEPAISVMPRPIIPVPPNTASFCIALTACFRDRLY
jgi:hypothetical protein